MTLWRSALGRDNTFSVLSALFRTETVTIPIDSEIPGRGGNLRLVVNSLVGFKSHHTGYILNCFHAVFFVKL